MKKFILLLIILLITPFLSFSQTESNQKSNVKTQSATRSTEIQQKQQIRVESQRPRNNTTVIYQHVPTWNRWNTWGAPNYFDRFDRFYFYDDFNVRRPARIYYRDGRKDTVKGKNLGFRFGLQYSTQNEIGGWITIGNKTYFILDFSTVVKNDRSQFYDNITLYDALGWNDEQLSNIEEGWSVYLGLGRKFKNTGAHLMFGFGEEQENFQFFDEFYILSNNGKYSFVNFVQDYFSIKLGITQDIKMITIKTDYDPIQKIGTFGLGFNF